MRIDPTKVPHLRKTDTESPVPDGLRRGLVPKQRSFSVQDVRDYSTPQGAAMANEEMHRLRDAIVAISEQVNTPVASTDTVTVAAEAPTPAILLPNDDEQIQEQNQYTVSHNLIHVGEQYKNIETNYFDGVVNDGDRYDIIFETFPVGNKANVKAYVNIPKTQIMSGSLYTEEFYTDKYFSNEPHALYSDIMPNYIKFGTVVYHDVQHNFGLDNKYELIWSITYIGDTSYRAIPLVVPIDGNTVRVYSSVRYELSRIWEYKNTKLMIIPEEETISKESLPKFFITLYSKNIIKFVLHGGYADTIIYNSTVHGGFANTTIYNSTINGGKA